MWRAYAALAHTLRRLQRSDPMVQGSFYLLRRKCGKPRCRCATGQLHASYVLTRSEEGKDRLFTVPKGQRAEVRRWAAEYRRRKRQGVRERNGTRGFERRQRARIVRGAAARTAESGSRRPAGGSYRGRRAVGIVVRPNGGCSRWPTGKRAFIFSEPRHSETPCGTPPARRSARDPDGRPGPR